jgi:Domain of unknown function (DUF397)
MSTPAWKKSSRCSSGGCVEVKLDETKVLVRDSKDLRSPELSFGATAWQTFIERVKSGELSAGDDCR